MEFEKWGEEEVVVRVRINNTWVRCKVVVYHKNAFSSPDSFKREWAAYFSFPLP